MMKELQEADFTTNQPHIFSLLQKNNGDWTAICSCGLIVADCCGLMAARSVLIQHDQQKLDRRKP